MKIVTMLALLLSGAMFMNQTIRAEDSQPPAQVQVKAVQPFPYKGNVASIDVGAKTFTIKGKNRERLFAVTATTQLLKDGAPGPWEDLKVGDAVSGRAIKKAEGQFEAVSVKFGAKAPAAEAGKPQ